MAKNVAPAGEKNRSRRFESPMKNVSCKESSDTCCGTLHARCCVSTLSLQYHFAHVGSCATRRHLSQLSHDTQLLNAADSLTSCGLGIGFLLAYKNQHRAPISTARVRRQHSTSEFLCGIAAPNPPAPPPPPSSCPWPRFCRRASFSVHATKHNLITRTLARHGGVGWGDPK